MAIAWFGQTITDEALNLGPLTLFQPMLQKADVAGVIDRHLPPGPQLEYSHGKVLSLLLAARLSQPTALMNIADWAEKSGADLLWNIPTDKLNDDRLGRSLDAFFEQRHSILAGVTDNVLRWADMPLDRLHFDTTHLIFYGVYPASTPRTHTPTETLRGNADLPPAHICRSYISKHKILQVGLTAAIDELGALPVHCHVLDGNRTGHTAIKEQFDLLNKNLPLPKQVLFVSDRGTCSAEYFSRMQRHGHSVVCAAPWRDYQSLYDSSKPSLLWQQASFLSREQQRRRDTGSSLPLEHYQLAVKRHSLIDPTTKQKIPCRVIFALSSAEAVKCRELRQKNILKIQTGLGELAAKLQRSHATTTPATIRKQVVALLGKREAASYFRWELVPLTEAERAALPAPQKCYRRQTHRLVYGFDAAAAAAEKDYDGLSVLVTTAPTTTSADVLFTQYKEQNYLERNHHQFKTPLAVGPVFLKSLKRVEALICLLHVALQIHQLLERLYRQRVPENAPASDKRRTAESIVRDFSVCAVLVRQSPIGHVIFATQPNQRQRQVLDRLQLPTPGRILAGVLPNVPAG